MDVSALLAQIFEFILALLDSVFAFAGNPGGNNDDDDDDDDD